jgi:hypothetical protein
MKKLLVSAFCALCLFSVVSLAQIQNGQFTGTVSDPSGAAIPNAKVTVTNTDTNLSATTTTSASGLYTFKELPPGTYRITAEASGFKTGSHVGVTLNAGVVQRVDFKMELGQAREIVEVFGQATVVNTEDSKLAATVGSAQIANLPLNGRNVYDLVKLNPGAVDTRNVDTENDGSPGGAGTVVNGVRQDFNGFTINGVSNKALSGGAVNQPIADTVQEFQLVTLNMSAQYGNSAGSITNLVTKSGTNDWHGSGFFFYRNDHLDANNFFNNQAKIPNPPLHFNQAGGTVGGPIVKNKVFFFLGYQHDHYLTNSTPTPIEVESPEWRAASIAANPNSVASLLYGSFVPKNPGTASANCVDPSGNTGQLCDLQNYLATNNSGDSALLPTGAPDYGAMLCPTSGYYAAVTPTDLAQATAAANKIGNIIGVTNADMAGNPTSSFQTGPCAQPIAIRPGVLARTGVPILNSTSSVFQQQVRNPGNLFNGFETSLRLDFNPNDRNRFFIQGNWMQIQDAFGPGLPQSARGFINPTQQKYPNLQLSFVHTFSPTVLNEFRAGYLLNTLIQRAGVPGVPAVALDDASMGFGSYNGYPQFFKENVYTYSDMVSVSHGNHNIKVGADFRRNIENSEFDVSRPSYYFFDLPFFAADLPYGEAGGVNPDLCSSLPCNINNLNPNPVSHLETNKRHWRNLEFGAYVQDDWKVSRRFTLNLGLRYDLFTRHVELNHLATTFLPVGGTNPIDNVTTGAGFVKNANAPLGAAGCPFDPFHIAASVVAGVCGPGGFAPSSQLGKPDHNDFGPRIGFAWDVFGDGKTSLRGGYGLSYEGTLYNPLSNSRWNPPYYSFNQAFNDLSGLGTENIVYGPLSGGAPSFSGPPDPLNHQGTGANSVGNIMGWDPTNQNLAVLTGIILPKGIRDPYVHNFFFSVQRELLPRTVLEVDYVGTAGHKLFRAEDINRVPGGLLPEGTCVKDNFGRQLCSQKDSTDRGDGLPINSSGKPNPNYGTLRNWQNVVNSNYNSLQASLKMQGWHGVTANISYTWSHSLDDGSTWHSGATTANGPAAGEGFTTDQTLPQLDRGNSIYDIRHRLAASYVYELPFFNHSGNHFLKAALGGWQWNGIWSFQTGAHWSPYCRSRAKAKDVSGVVVNTGCDFNLDGGRNDRPNALAQSVHVTHDMWANGWQAPFTNTDFSLTGNGSAGNPGSSFFTRPCPGCVGNLGRNTFEGPNFFGVDMSLFKNFQITERVGVQLRWEVFNVFNRTNFQLPGASGATNNRVVGASGAFFGQAGGAFDPRQQQLGAKISF